MLRGGWQAVVGRGVVGQITLLAADTVSFVAVFMILLKILPPGFIYLKFCMPQC